MKNNLNFHIMINSDLKWKLEHLKQLLDSKSITDSEYNTLKEEILFKINNFEDLIPEKESNQFDGEQQRNQDKSIIYNKQKSKKNYSGVYIAIFLLIGLWFLNLKNNKNNYESNSNNDSVKTSNDINDSRSNNLTTTCKICGRSFSGDGYDKIDGIWQKNKRLLYQ